MIVNGFTRTAKSTLFSRKGSAVHVGNLPIVDVTLATESEKGDLGEGDTGAVRVK